MKAISMRNVRKSNRNSMFVLLKNFSMLLFVLMFLGSPVFAQDGAGGKSGAPTGEGKLRVGVNLTNVLTVTKDPASGELRGIAVELGQAIAHSLGKDVEIVAYPSAGKLVEAAVAGEWDIGFMAVDASRASTIAFTKPYIEILNSYLVPPGSPIRSVEDVDQKGVRVVVQGKNATDLFLSRHLLKAHLVRDLRSEQEILELLRRGDADVMAAGQKTLLEFSKGWEGSVVLEPHVMAIPHGIGVPLQSAAIVPELNAFLRDSKSSGVITSLIDKYKLIGVRVAD
ncbi:transporter substrate-binding domain-containing protein [Agrobacterium sp. NPDC090283]|uniref:transporter substrate-binding domain-containing protein n=1 Tax=Agrobacterium sp. NPDC090283 TaxID=3363920 RepID=UPI00383BCA50